MNFCKDCEHHKTIAGDKSPEMYGAPYEICLRKAETVLDIITGAKLVKGECNARTERTINKPAYCGEVGRFFQPKRKNTLEQFTNVLSNSIHKTLSFLWDR